ncbi:hypothetical protein SeMB42_g04054 [Synchytrium endobioticum]|uniref:Transcription factor Iwr1 domain-containing protein n=1 Tax=Synchytrium endobioticum TaxID=286115 RepID=A0A507D1N7_9FUNG|nr:hypothetical protein SeMB42_g04054 [Synchytrium endobioticum]TPX50992.1 hypothetical protein SeLEV6574_g00589 [Synchytrium endobioticum]
MPLRRLDSLQLYHQSRPISQSMSQEQSHHTTSDKPSFVDIPTNTESELEEGEIKDDTDTNIPIPSLKELLERAEAAAAREARPVIYPRKPTTTTTIRRVPRSINVNSKRFDSYRPSATRHGMSHRSSRQKSQGLVDQADTRAGPQDGHGKLVYVPPPLSLALPTQPPSPQDASRRSLLQPASPNRRFAPYSTSGALRQPPSGMTTSTRNRTYSPALLRPPRGWRQGPRMIGGRGIHHPSKPEHNHPLMPRARGRIYRGRGAYIPYHSKAYHNSLPYHSPNIRGRFRRQGDIWRPPRPFQPHHERKPPVMTDSVGVQATLDFPSSPPQSGAMTPGGQLTPASTPYDINDPDWPVTYEPSPIHYADDDEDDEDADMEAIEAGYRQHGHHNIIGTERGEQEEEEEGEDTVESYYSDTDMDEQWLEVGAGTPWYQRENHEEELWALYHSKPQGEAESSDHEHQHNDVAEVEEVYSPIQGTFPYADNNEERGQPYLDDDELEEFDPVTGQRMWADGGGSDEYAEWADPEEDEAIYQYLYRDGPDDLSAPDPAINYDEPPQQSESVVQQLTESSTSNDNSGSGRKDIHLPVDDENVDGG